VDGRNDSPDRGLVGIGAHDRPPDDGDLPPKDAARRQGPTAPGTFLTAFITTERMLLELTGRPVNEPAQRHHD
jgi:hypothetical protein